MNAHPFDEALRLAPAGGHRWSGTPSAAYQNMVGPFGGLTAASFVQALLQHPERLGEPLALTVNFAGPVADAPFVIEARPVRTNRSSQHWTLTLSHDDAEGRPLVATTGTAVTALRRETWHGSDTPMPAVPPPEACAPAARLQWQPEWLRRYELRPVSGALPAVWDGGGDASTSEVWVRDAPPRPLDHAALAAMCDIFFPRIWLRRATQVPAGTVSMTAYFHASAAELAACGESFLFARAAGQEFRHGFCDQSAQLWSAAGRVLATSHQIVYYRQ